MLARAIPRCASWPRRSGASSRRRLPELERQVRLLLLPKDADDEKSAILEIRAGTGGDEAALFAGDLFRMYQRYADLKGWRCEVLSLSESDLGGLKEVVAEISGQGVFARLKYEAGVHRVQRVPVTEGSGRIHTSAATVAVLPEAEDVDIVIDDKDLRIDVYRASGAGGQHVNRTESAVRITHLPTGLVVAIQDEKSQHKNKAKALKILKARLYEQERAAKASERAANRKGQVGSGDRSERIRTYNFPQNRLTDHRINLTLYKLDQVVTGEALDEVIEPLINEDAGGAAGRGRVSTVAELLGEARQCWRAAACRAPTLRGAPAARGRRPASTAPRLLADPRQAWPKTAAERFRGWVARRAGREPMAYIFGRAEFWSLDFAVGPGVLVPRADSETLIEAAIAALPRPEPAVADPGYRRGLRLPAPGAARSISPTRAAVGTDASAAALACARRNADGCGLAWSRSPGPARPGSSGVDGAVRSRGQQPALYPQRRDRRAAARGRALRAACRARRRPDGLDAYRAILPSLPRLLATRTGGVSWKSARARKAAVVAIAGCSAVQRIAARRSGRDRALPRASPTPELSARSGGSARGLPPHRRRRRRRPDRRRRPAPSAWRSGCRSPCRRCLSMA